MASHLTKMVNENVSSLCRICLESGATCLIFKEVKEENSIYFKLRECFKDKIEDIKGYPRLICDECRYNLDIVFNFIKTFKQSHKLLKDGLVIFKQEETDDNSNMEVDQCSERKIELEGIKTEPNNFLDSLEDTDNIMKFLQPSVTDADNVIEENLVKKINLSIKTEKPKKLSNNKNANSTSRVAASILEGEFSWTGDNWCLKSTLLKIPKVKQEVNPKRRNTKMKLPRKPTVKLPKLCDLCGDTFKSQYKLSLHRKKVHFSIPMPCKQCSRICSSEINLLRHIKRKHSISKEFICSTCGSSFAFKGDLSNHINKLHKNRVKKIFACKYCDKKYLSQKSIVIHERSAHTGERPVECSVCFKRFFHEDYLKEHMRLHTGEAPYKCPVCGRGYAQRGNMKSHLRIHRITEIDAVTLSRIKPNYLKLLKI